MNKFQLGDRVKDLVSGFEGICTGRLEYLNGCVQYQVTPKRDTKTGKMIDGYYIDDFQLKLVKAGAVPAYQDAPAEKATPDTSAGRTGGPSTRVAERTGP